MPTFQITNTYDHPIYIAVGTADDINQVNLETQGTPVEAGATISGEVGEQEIMRTSHPVTVTVLEVE